MKYKSTLCFLPCKLFWASWLKQNWWCLPTKCTSVNHSVCIKSKKPKTAFTFTVLPANAHIKYTVFEWSESIISCFWYSDIFYIERSFNIKKFPILTFVFLFDKSHLGDRYMKVIGTKNFNDDTAFEKCLKMVSLLNNG